MLLFAVNCNIFLFWPSNKTKQKKEDAYLTVNIAVIGLLTFATLKKIFFPVMT